MKKYEALNNYMIHLREEFDKLAEKEDSNVQEKACRIVCEKMFKSLTYGLSDTKLQRLNNVIDDYKNKRIYG